MLRKTALLSLPGLLVACTAESPSGDADAGTVVVDTGTDTTTGGDGSGDDTVADTPPDVAADAPPCLDEDDDGFGDGCAAGPDCDDTDPDVSPDAAELCGDLIDNDCTGVIDDACPCTEGAFRACSDGPTGADGIGLCRAGVQSCSESTWSACTGAVTPIAEVCDGLDNDCDGQIDDGVTNACGTCGDVQVEVCEDGFDNDCNGVIDDVTAGCVCGGRLDQPCYSGPVHTIGVGVCRGGVTDCVEGRWAACEGERTPTAEVCDGLDNDCDGSVDEGARNRCGACDAAEPVEVCDGADNDCDGSVDEGVRGACGLCASEVTREVCDGFDNDCDGSVDEACPCVGDGRCYPGAPATLGVGSCAAGTQQCSAIGEAWEACTGYVLPAPEVCDGADNDCDGTTDLDARGCSVCGSADEVCDDLDNDCDGEVDEGLRNACGDCFSGVVPEETGGAELCDGADNDCDGLIDEGLVNDCGTCDDDGCIDCDFFEPGWSAAERCGDGQDNDGNGVADDGCTCTFGATQACFLGAPNSRRIGACLDGLQVCIDRDAPHWGPCEGGVVPATEICDEKDNDCNGCTDEGTCDVMLACPVEDFVRPLRYYFLEGSFIYDGLGGPATDWSWTIDAPLGSGTAGAEDPDAETTRFFVDVSGDYRVTVTFTVDGTEFTCTWIVHAVGDGLRVELTWNTQGTVDLDLHLHEPRSTAPWCTNSDCYYANCDGGDAPPWGYADSSGEPCPGGAGTCRNPRLDIDNIDLVDVPENINIDNPSDGDRFRVMVHYYGFRGSDEAPPTQPIVSIYCGGLLGARLGEAPDVVVLGDAGTRCRGDTWRVADVTMAVDPATGVQSCTVDVLSDPGGASWLILRDTTAF